MWVLPARLIKYVIVERKQKKDTNKQYFSQGQYGDSTLENDFLIGEYYKLLYANISKNIDKQLCVKNTLQGLPWWLSGKESPASAGDLGLIPDSSGFHIPRSNQACAPQLLILCSGAWEPQLLSLYAAATVAHKPWRPGSAAREATAMRSLFTETRE